jgi:hypothetical protein
MLPPAAREMEQLLVGSPKSGRGVKGIETVAEAHKASMIEATPELTALLDVRSGLSAVMLSRRTARANTLILIARLDAR